MELDRKQKVSKTSDSRIKVTEWIASDAGAPEIRAALLAEFSAVAPTLDVESLTRSSKPEGRPILDISIARSANGALVAITQNAKRAWTAGQTFLAIFALLVLGAGMGVWVPAILAPAAIWWRVRQEKHAPFFGEQMEQCLRNLKIQLEHQPNRPRVVEEESPLVEDQAPKIDTRRERLEALTMGDSLVNWILTHASEVESALRSESECAQVLLRIDGCTSKWAAWLQRNGPYVIDVLRLTRSEEAEGTKKV